MKLLERLDLSPPADGRDVVPWLDKLADIIAADVARVLRNAVDSAVRSFLSGLTAAGDGSPLDGITEDWGAYVDDELAEAVTGVHSAGALTAWVQAPGTDLIPQETAERWASVMNESAVEYQRDATNRLVAVGDQVWGTVRGVTVKALEQGLNGEELKSAIEGVTDFSEFRADTVGRTETMAAYNAGDHAGARELGEFGPAEKFWMAALDARTRESHVEADGQTVGFDDPFIVGGEQMMYPLDAAASPAEVVNCRCVVGHLYPGDERPDGTIVPEREPVIVDPEPEPEPSIKAEIGAERTPKFARIDAAADKHGVSRAQVANYMQDGPKVAAAIKAEAAQSAADSFAFLDRFEGLQIKRPPRGARGGEYDFLERLSQDERNRLSSGGWYTDRASAGIDVLHDVAVRVGAIRPEASIDDFIGEWLHHTRVIDASKSVRAGRWPDTDRFGNFDPASLAPATAEQGLDAAKIIGKDKWDQAGYLAQQTLEGAADDAYRMLDVDAISGVPPWRMSFDTWRAEVGDLEYDLDNGVDVATAGRRYDELVPRMLDTGQNYETLYAEIVEVARVAKVDVASWANIPWEVVT